MTSAHATHFPWMAWGGVLALIEADNKGRHGAMLPNRRDFWRQFEWVDSEGFALAVIKSAALAEPLHRVEVAIDCIRAERRRQVDSWPSVKDESKEGA